MSGKTILIAGTIVEHEKVTGGVPTWKRIPRVTEIGSVGDQAETYSSCYRDWFSW